MLNPAARDLLMSGLVPDGGPSTTLWFAVTACTVLITAFSTLNLECITAITGEMQLVVHEAFEIIFCPKYCESLTPIKKVCVSPPLVGAEITTFFAPAVICAFEASSSVNLPVHSRTVSTFRSPQGNFKGSFSENTRLFLPSTTI